MWLIVSYLVCFGNQELNALSSLVNILVRTSILVYIYIGTLLRHSLTIIQRRDAV